MGRDIRTSRHVLVSETLWKGPVFTVERQGPGLWHILEGPELNSNKAEAQSK